MLQDAPQVIRDGQIDAIQHLSLRRLDIGHQMWCDNSADERVKIRRIFRHHTFVLTDNLIQ